MLGCLLAAIAACGALAAEIPLTSGDVQLSLDPATGRISGVAVGGRPIETGRSPHLSGFSIADHAAGCEFVPVKCRAVEQDGRLVLEGAALGVRLHATMALGEGSLRSIDARLHDTTGSDRAISLRFSLPVAGEGWTFHRNLDRSIPITGGDVLDNATGCAVGSGKLDLWPITAISSERATLALGTRIDRPQISHASFDGSTDLFSLTIDVALTELTRKHPREANVALGVYGAANGWGLRGVLDAYHGDLVSQRGDGGGWFAWGDILHIAPPVSDFGLRFHEAPIDADALQHNRSLGIESFPYIEPSMFQLHFGDFNHHPTRNEIMQRLIAYAAEADAEASASTDTGPYRNVKQMCRAILASGVRDADGELVIGAVGQYPWVAGSRWAAQFPLVLDPDIPGGAAELYLDWLAANIRRPDWGDGQYLDSYSSHLTTVDYDPKHLAAADLAACFDPTTLQPCQLIAMPAFEYVAGLRRRLGARKILVNAYNHNAPCPFHEFDVVGKEHWMSPSGRLFERYRALAPNKVVTNLPSDEPVDDLLLDECLVLDVFPGGYGRGDWGQEQMREGYRRVVPLLRLLADLEWHPVPWTTASAPEVRVERYGRTGDQTCIVVHNPFAAQVVSLTVDTRRIGLPNRLWCRELLHERALAWKQAKPGLTVQVALGARETALIAIGNSAGQGEISRRLAVDREADARLCAIEWGLRENENHPLLERTADTSGEPAELIALSVEASALPGPINERMAELLRRAAALHGESVSARPARSRPVPIPEQAAAGAELPWLETFDSLDPQRWSGDLDADGVSCEGGELRLELTGNSRGLSLRSTEPFDFGTRPLEFRYRFTYNHAGHEWYLMQSFRLLPTASGTADDFLHIRCDPRLQIRVENGDAPATNWQRTLTDWRGFAPDRSHEAVLVIDTHAYRLTIDGIECGSGPHELGFAQAYIDIGLYSGHGGHGDTCSFDEIEVRAAASE